MNARHGAVIGTALAAISLLGIINLTPQAPGGPAPFAPAPIEARETAAIERIAPFESEAPASVERHASLAPSTPGVADLLLRGSVAQFASCAEIYLDFDGTPREGAVPLTSQFVTRARFGDASGPLLTFEDVIGIEWYFNQNNFMGQPTRVQSITPGVALGNQPQPFTYENPGRFDVGMRLLVRNPGGEVLICPPPGEPPFIKTANPATSYILATQDVDAAAADFEVVDIICDEDSEAVLPLNDWIGILAFDMTFGDEVARRTLTQLQFQLSADPRGSAELGYLNAGSIQRTDILEFGLFLDTGPDGEPDRVLSLFEDGFPEETAFGSERIVAGQPMLRWENTGFPFEMPVGADALGNPIFSYDDVSYNLNFTFASCQDGFDPNNPFATNNPQFPFFASDRTGPQGGRVRQWVTSGPDPRHGYILAMRVSPSFQAGRTIATRVTAARMQPYTINLQTGEPVVFPFPFANDGPLDNYSPNFFDGEIVAEECGRSSSFGVWDVTGNTAVTGSNYNPGAFPNPWQYPQKAYNLVPEFTRPRWDVPGILLDRVFGNTLGLRNLAAMEAWVPLLGIDMHGGCGSELTEINLIMTDVGADPYGPPGNGGFDPRTALNPIVPVGDRFNESGASGLDFAFNGLWVWYDSGGGNTCDSGNCDGDGIFNAPTPTLGSGITFNTDTPLRPRANYVPEWEYVPFPPGGGDPWWKIRLEFQGGRRRVPDAACLGTLEPIPDVFESINPGQPQPDFFVVMRPDSGFTDASGVPGNGNGIVLGSEMRTFIEPLRWDAQSGRYAGGIGYSGQVVSNLGVATLDPLEQSPYSHSDTCPTRPLTGSPVLDLLGNYPEPFWFERTHNRDNVKPVRSGLEVHDLVLTYFSGSLYSKRTNIHVGAPLIYRNQNDPRIIDTVPFSMPFWVDSPLFTNNITQQIGLSVPFAPPFGIGIMSLRFRLPQFPLVGRTSSHYAYETVPFQRLPTDVVNDTPNVLPRDPFFPNPYAQPTLPDFRNWPPKDEPVAFGFTSFSYLADEGVPNEPFNFPSSNGSEDTYRDDVYAYVLEDLQGGFADGEFEGMWLIDREGGRFFIDEHVGNTLFLRHGHASYVDNTFLNGAPFSMQVPNYPFGVEEGPQAAVRRGAWVVARDVSLRNEYNKVEQWPLGYEEDGGSRAARLLKQHIGINSQPVAMLGVNVVGSEDPVVNQGGNLSLNSITVAFWGPDFERTHLARLDPNGELFSSGVLLYEDTNGNGVFDAPISLGGVVNPAFQDRIVALEPNSLQWPLEPEPIDLNGDFQPDDLSGDGVVYLGDPDALTPEELAVWDGLDDRAWVLRLQPDLKWVVPRSDTLRPDNAAGASKSALLDGDPVFRAANWPDFWLASPVLLDYSHIAGKADEDGVAKDFLPRTVNEGDDLFVVVRTSETLPQFAQFRAVVPSTLPARLQSPTNPNGSGAAAQAGIELSPRTYPVTQSFVKTNPEEGVVDFHGHDMLEASVPARLIDLTAGLVVAGQPGFDPLPAVPLIEPGGPPVAVLGIDVSANRPQNLIAKGTGTGGKTDGTTKADRSFVTAGLLGNPAPSAEYFDGTGWTNGVLGLYLVSLGAETGRVEAYEITGVNGNTLALRAGNPRDGAPWEIVKDPTFLEEVIVELYDITGTTPGLPGRGDGRFDPQYDLLELNHEDPINGQISGVSIWRDNDFHPQNRNGVFDPPITDAAGNVIEYIDLPVLLDSAPHFVGVQGQPEYQVRFTFASPGTDNFARGRDSVPYDAQPLLRQPIPQTFGRATGDQEFGSDFFVVLRSSRRMSEGDNFAVGIASWGPDTPSEVDPDNFRVSNIPGVPQTQIAQGFSLFRESPWSQRGLGFITLFRDAPTHYYWGFDQLERRVVARQEPDVSQTQPLNRPLRNWVRSSPNVFALTNTITALPSPTVDFRADRNRQAPGQPVNFTLLATGTIVEVLWDFGDGTTSTERNPTKIYQQPGLYDVSVTVTDRFGIKDTELKPQYIEILPPPFADFTANPTDGPITPDLLGSRPPGLDVYFRNTSVGTDDIVPVSYFWNFGDGGTSTEAGFPTNPDDPTSTNGLVLHRYTEPGIYTVSLQVTFRNTGTGQTVTSVCTLRDLIVVRPCIGCPSGEGEGEGEGSDDPPAADFTVHSQIDARDRESLVPLMDWVPLFRFTMGFGEDADNFAPRFLRSLIFTLRPDEREAEDLNYGNQGPPEVTDILEFALFEETFGDNERDGVLDAREDFIRFTWDNFGRASDGTQLATIVSGFPLTYSLNFIGNGTPQAPQFPVAAGPTGDGTIDGRSYIIGMRTSETWRSQLTVGVDVLSAQMVRPETGNFPVNDEGEPIDSYSPNFFDGEIFEEDASYSSSFSVFDMTGRPFPDGFNVPGANFTFETLPNTWNHPIFAYTPAAEFSRPRWNSVNNLLEMFSGEILQMRKLLPLEQWVPVLGINLHSTKPAHRFGDPLAQASRQVDFLDYTLLQEVNLVVTDVGADPFGPPGNGGFDPREGLDNVTDASFGVEPVIDRDFVYNGAWVFYDNNNNGAFDPPVQQPTGGVRYSGSDRPMVPGRFVDEVGNGEWEYIPFPPGGGDPWWRLKMRFSGFAARFASEGDDPIGWVERAPDNHAGDDASTFSELSFDYFVTIRADSGFRDISTVPGDGVGIQAGADFRAFIEPRRFNATTGSYDGGIYVDSMIPPIGPRFAGSLGRPWQDDVRWSLDEPWWPERTVSPEAVKPLRVGLEVHDLTLLYESDSQFAGFSDLFFGASPFAFGTCFGFSFGLDEPTDFERWVDPFGLRRERFLNRHTVGVIRISPRGRFFRPIQVDTLAGPLDVVLQVNFNSDQGLGHYAFETVPFFRNTVLGGDVPPGGPRSAAFPIPPDQPALPEYATWTATLAPGEYPRLSDWDPVDAGARLLTQKTEIDSTHTPLLGINLVGADDLSINLNEPIRLARMTVAFWGPDFTPAKLRDLDPQGRTRSSGILLWEDADQDGTFFDADTLQSYDDAIVTVGGVDRIVPLRNLQWGDRAELIDLTGDGQPDDLNGDGVVDDRDKAWVVRIDPENLWELPRNDNFAFEAIQGVEITVGFVSCGSLTFSKEEAEQLYSTGEPETLPTPKQIDDNKALDPEGNHPGDDLFLTVRLSDKAKRFEKIRAVIPATLPQRPLEADRLAGIQFFPQVATSAGAFTKSNPEEDPVQDFYGHDTMEVGVPTKLTDLTTAGQTITIGGPAVPVLGIDAATNRPEGTRARGGNGVGADGSFTVANATWTPGAFVGDFLLDNAYESYEIVGNTNNQLQLLSGTPRDGAWRIVTEPTFLEQVVVEFYNAGLNSDFNPLTDLLPLNLDQRVSGVALYRDNDNHPGNSNGIFDPGIDIPITLDAAPVFIGQSGEDIQVKFVFSTPGTDDVSGGIQGPGLRRDQQTRNRQWVPDTFGTRSSDEFFGSDFFVVVRASDRMSPNDNFRVGIVSWGPNTPTEPDPDTWSALPEPFRNEFAKFQEFPWGSRAVGYITFFKEPQVRYFMDGAVARQQQDTSGFNWVRTHPAKKRQTGTITAQRAVESPTSIRIDVSNPKQQLPSQTLPGQSFSFVLRGKGFGTQPSVVISGYDVTVGKATDTAIELSVQTRPGAPPQEPIVVIVRNPTTKQEVSRSDVFVLTPGNSQQGPKVNGVTPGRATERQFPVTVIGTDFPADPGLVEVLFGGTRMPVLTATGNSVTVGFPAGGMPRVGRMDVTVRHLGNGTQGTAVNAFEFNNNPAKPTGGLFGCGGGAGGGSGGAGDALVAALMALGLAAGVARRGVARR